MFLVSLLIRVSIVYNTEILNLKSPEYKKEILDLDFLKTHVDELCDEEPTNKNISKNSVTIFLNYFLDDALKVIRCVYRKSFQYEPHKQKHIKIKPILPVYYTDSMLLRMFFATEMVYGQRNYLLNLNRLTLIFFPEDYKVSNFFNLFITNSSVERKYFYEFVLREYLFKENELKIVQINGNPNKKKNPLQIFSNKVLVLKEQYAKIFKTNFYSYYAILKVLLKEQKSKSTMKMTLSLLFFFINQNIFGSKDFKYLMAFCKEFVYLKYLNVEFRSYVPAMNAIHYILTISIFNFRCLIILLFGKIESFFAEKYIPVYKHKILSHFRTRLLILIYFLIIHEQCKVSHLNYEKNINLLLQAIFYKVNDIKMENSELLKVKEVENFTNFLIAKDNLPQKYR